jgi:hypothetical protein
MEKLGELAKVLAFGAGESFDPDPTRWETWQCSGCGEAMAQPARMPDWQRRPLGSLCQACEAAARPARATREAILERAGVPVTYRRPFIAPAAWPQDRRPERAGIDLAAWRGQPWCVLAGGAVEGGKTMLLTELMARLLPVVRSGVWCRGSEIVRTLYSAAFQDREAEWRRYAEAGVLLVDDLGRDLGEAGWKTVAEVLTVRYDHQRPTLITTNMPVRPAKRDAGGKATEPPGLADIDAGLYRRLREGLIVGMTEPWRPA